MNISIKEMHSLKLEAENKIHKLLDEFHHKTGVTVTQIDFELFHHLGGRVNVEYVVLEVKL